MYKKLQVFNIHNLMSSDMNTYSHDTITIIKITNVSITSKKKERGCGNMFTSLTSQSLWALTRLDYGLEHSSLSCPSPWAEHLDSGCPFLPPFQHLSIFLSSMTDSVGRQGMTPATWAHGDHVCHRLPISTPATQICPTPSTWQCSSVS